LFCALGRCELVSAYVLLAFNDFWASDASRSFEERCSFVCILVIKLIAAAGQKWQYLELKSHSVWVWKLEQLDCDIDFHISQFGL
jgi:hypothetical protein